MHRLKSSEQGLTTTEARERLKKYGRNSLPQKNQLLIIHNIISQFYDLLVIILIIAGILSLILGDSRTATVMFAVVLLNAGIGFWQQYKTERILVALKNLLPPVARVIRQGKEMEILASEIVPGDIVIVQAGDAVAADGRIIESYSFKVNESSLTGESNPQTKHATSDPHHPNNCQIFMSTTVLEGEAKFVVVSTGAKTEFGKIAIAAENTISDISPLQKKLRVVGKTVSTVALTIMVLMITYQLIKNRLIDGEAITPNFVREIFLFGLALGAALVPEGLPATVSVALSLGASRLAKKNAVVKKLSSVETLGDTQVICTDKTGTLTFGKMTVTSLWPHDSQHEIKFNNLDLYNYRDILINWLTCQNVKFTDKGLFGDPNEIAILEAAINKKIDIKEFAKKYKRIHEFSFNSVRKMSSVIVEDHLGHYLYTKGNPAVLIEKCNLSPEESKEVIRRTDDMAARGIRVLAFAHKEIVGFSHQHIHSAKHFEHDLIFDGLAGIEDDIRPEVAGSVEYCHRAGIRIVMITGDYKVTAEATANQLNLSGGGDSRLISGEELYGMSDLALRENLLHPCVFYQTDPRQKLRIVESLQNMNLTVAVTGDGVNDALALKKADIGVAMGKSGTEVAREAADMILLDDNFATIVNAVLEGRIIRNNLKRFLFYVFSSNAGEFMTAFLGVVLGMPLPILAVQILSVDLGTDVLPSLALTADIEDQEYLTRQGNERAENLLGREILMRLLYVGVIMGGGAVLIFWLINRGGAEGSELYYKATGASFAVLVVCQVVNVFSLRGGFRNIKYALFSNKYLIWSVAAQIVILIGVIYWAPLQRFLSTRPLDLSNWLSILAVGAVFLVVEEFRINREKS